MFICAGNGEEFKFAQSIGVGLVESAICLTRICATQSPEFLCFVGSAGSYDFDLPLLEICVSEEATQIETSFLEDRSYTPISLHERSLSNVSCETIQTIKSLDLHPVVVNSSNYITTDSQISQTMRTRGMMLENMEFFSVLAVARRFGLPVIGIFCVSNYCHPDAHIEFVKSRGEVARKIEALAMSLNFY